MGLVGHWNVANMSNDELHELFTPPERTPEEQAEVDRIMEMIQTRNEESTKMMAPHMRKVVTAGYEIEIYDPDGSISKLLENDERKRLGLG